MFSTGGSDEEQNKNQLGGRKMSRSKSSMKKKMSSKMKKSKSKI